MKLGGTPVTVTETEELRDLLRQAIEASDDCCQCLSYRCSEEFWKAVERLLPDLYEERQ